MIKALVIGLIAISYCSSAYAYLDPGTGSMIIQFIIGVAAASLFVIKQYWYSIKSFFTRNKKKREK